MWTVDRGREQKRHCGHSPPHIVLATGTPGKPNVPTIPSAESFKGSILHTIEFRSAEEYKGKRVVVVGAGNTSADICQDLVVRGAQSVTMVRRSPTLVSSIDVVKARFDLSWPEGLPTEVANFRNAAMPWGLLRKMAVAAMQKGPGPEEKKILEQAEKGGLKLKTTADAGYLGLIYERFGGFWINQGVTRLIGEGKFQVKSSLDVQTIGASNIRFLDGTTLEADAIIFATGYHKMRDSMNETFGSETIDQTSEVWGMNEEGKVKGMYRNPGHLGCGAPQATFLTRECIQNIWACKFKRLK